MKNERIYKWIKMPLSNVKLNEKKKKKKHTLESEN